MAKKNTDGSFGLDPETVGHINWDLALKRASHDLKSDFIWAPHLRYLYRFAGQEIISSIKSDLNAGTYTAGVPLTIEVPKSFRIVVGSVSKRLGPSFSRPGSILLPKDRIFYQAMADQSAPLIASKIDHSKSFSHRLSDADDESMFLSTRVCWNRLQAALKKVSLEKKYKYVLKLDIFDYFGSINQHNLINILKDNGLKSSLADRLERILLSYTGQRNSRGILQGLYPSDLFGAFYMHPIDRFFDDNEIASARYVDDMYLFVDSIDSADRILRILIPHLRLYDLNLNEVKSKILLKSSLFSEEPDLEELFSEAVEEVKSQIDDDDVEEGYGFQEDWEDSSDEDDQNDEDESEKESSSESFELEATKALFDSISNFPGHEESIERFCLPLFSKEDSDYAINYVMDALRKRPSMTQIYAAYLGKFPDNKIVQDFLLETLSEDNLFDWQKMWLIAAMMQVKLTQDNSVKVVMGILKDGNRHDGLRAVAAMYVGRFGDLARRKDLFAVYQNVSEYVQTAIYFSSRGWPPVERKNARSSWGGHGNLNKFMSIAIDAAQSKTS